MFSGRAFRVGVTTGLGPLPAWKQTADVVFVQVGFSLERLLAWRAEQPADLSVYAGVMVIASSAMARRLSATVADIAVPEPLVSALDANPDAGIDAAFAMLEGIRDSGCFAGVHLVPVGRYRQVAARLDRDGHRSMR